MSNASDSNVINVPGGAPKGRRRLGHDNLTKAMEATAINLNENMAEAEEKVGFDFFGLAILIVEVIMITLMFVFCRYTVTNTGVPTVGGDDDVERFWQFLRDVTVMIVIGFGYLMTFLKRHRFSAIGYTFFICVVVVQWNILVQGFYTYVLSRSSGTPVAEIIVSFPQLVLGMFCAGTVLISFGVWLGKVGPEQLLFLALLETLFYTTNGYIIEGLLHVRDVGGTMVIHMFGAYFGLAAGRFISPADTRDRALYAGASYTGDTFSMIGTIFLWICWPSFNSALVPPQRQYVAIYNTVLSLCGCTMVTFAMSRMLRKARHFTMEDLQNATLAGGVAMGASADILMSPGAAVLIGGLSGALSVFGFAILGPIAQRKLRIYDTCGVHNLHGMPAILGAIASAIVASQVFVFGTSAQADLHHGPLQWGFQLASMCVTLGIAIVGGIISGWLVMKIKAIPKPKGKFLFDDSEYFEIPDVFEAGEAPSRMASIQGPMQQEMQEVKPRTPKYDQMIDL